MHSHIIVYEALDSHPGSEMNEGLEHEASVATFIKLSRVKEEILLYSVALTEFDEGFQVVNLKW